MYIAPDDCDHPPRVPRRLNSRHPLQLVRGEPFFHET